MRNPMPEPVDWTALEKASRLLAAVPERVRRSAHTQAVSKSAQLFARGDRPQAMYFVVSGEIHLVRSSLSGDQLVLQRAQRGFLAEASLDQAKYHCDAVAVRPSQLLVIPRKAFRDALADEEFSKVWIAHLSGELRRVRAQAERMALKTAEARILHYVEAEGNNGSISLNRSKKEWANELGLTHEALYRALARMQRNGHIRADAKSLTILSSPIRPSA
jgi:CRP-like cAMP-binding protein